MTITKKQSHITVNRNIERTNSDVTKSYVGRSDSFRDEVDELLQKSSSHITKKQKDLQFILIGIFLFINILLVLMSMVNLDYEIMLLIINIFILLQLNFLRNEWKSN